MENTMKKGKPLGFYFGSLAFSFERCAYYTVKYMMAIWISTSVGKGGLGLTPVQATALAAWFVSMTYITPIIGGYLADYWISPRLSVVLGMILMGVGYGITFWVHTIPMVWLMIILVAVGTGFFKGNMSGINGLFFTDAKELDDAFSVQYTFVNIGSFIGTTFLVLAIPAVGFRGVFLISGILLLIDAIMYIAAGPSLGDAGKKPFKIDQRKFESAGTKDETDAPLTGSDRNRILAIVLVTIFSIVFWILWYLAYYPVYFYFGYGDPSYMQRANWFIGSFHVPTSYFDSMNALVCIALGPVLGKLWTKLAMRPQGDMSMFKKTALGMIFMGASYVVMVFADMISHGHASVLWIFLVAIVMSIGEMVFSPLGNSFISKLAPAKVMGLLLGVWPFAVFIATRIYPSIYAWLSSPLPVKASGMTNAIAAAWQRGYGLLGAGVIILGLILWFASKKLDSLEKA